MARAKTNVVVEPVVTVESITAVSDVAETVKGAPTHVRADVWQQKFTVKTSKAAPEHTLTVDIDFGGVTGLQMITWACRSLVIDIQRSLRTFEEDFVAALDGQVIQRHATNVTFKKSEQPLTGAQVARKAAELPDHEREALIRELLAMRGDS